MYQPKISIITVVYNGKDLIKGTIKSVLNQDYRNIEYIIIDGASKDGTQAIIASYESQIDVFISEKDKGLYDAMNKGIQQATGDYLWFMNCGDHIADTSTVSRMLSNCTEDTDVIYGEVLFVDENRKPVGTRSEVTVHQLPDDLTWHSMRKGMVVSHQAFLPKRTLAPLYIENNLTADIDWVIKILKKSKEVLPTQMILAHFLTGGISSRQHKQSMKDRYQVLKNHFGFVPNLFNHGLIVLRALMRSK